MNRVYRLRARANEQEYRALDRLAQLEARTPSEMLRELVRRAAVEKGVWGEQEANNTEGREE